AIQEICGGPADFSFECTGVIPVVRQAVDVIGMLGTCILIGGAPAGADFSVDHLTTLWGKRIVGVLGGSGRSEQLIPTLVALHQQGRFPFDRLVTFFELDEIEEALVASHSGDVLKPVIRMPQG
ncbi:MAG: zinc-binding dehydrogenase, partial [Aeromicrobium sp.]